MQYELRTSAKIWAASAGMLVFALVYLVLAASQFLASHCSAASNATLLRRAVSLDPGNAEYPYRLGHFELLAGQAPQAALPWLQSATRLNPYAAKYWVDLAVARQALGDSEGEAQALARALAAGPRTPAIAWEAANLYLAQGSTEAAMKQFRTVLENDPRLTFPAMNTCWKIRPEVDYLLANVVPPKAYPDFLEFLISKDQAQASAEVWEHMVSMRQTVERRYLLGYLNYLITHHQPEQAGRVWRQGVGLSGLEAYQSSPENLIINGDFSLEILNGGFDWTHYKVPGVGLGLDPSETHSSGRSLRIVLDGPGITDAGIRQVVPVEPHTSYQVSAFYKAQDMDGAGAMKLMVQDFYRETPLFLSDDLGNADFWRQTGGAFTTGADTRLVVVRIARVPAGSPIRGKLWVDGLQLKAVEGKAGQKETQ